MFFSGTKFKMIVVGDAMQDTFVDLADAEVTEHGGMKKLCLRYADKIPAKHIRHQVAGNAANVAVSCSRLGLRTGIYTVVGDDSAGEMIRKTMKKENVSEKFIETDEDKMNNYSIVLNYQTERTILVYHEDRDYTLPDLPRSEFLYFTSLGNTNGNNTSFFRLHDAVIKHCKKNKIKLAFNPGTYQLKLPKKNLFKILKETFILFINVEEAQHILKTKNRELSFLLSSFKKIGVKNTVITDGPKGAYAYDGKNAFFMDIFPSKVVERTGAGDSFASATVSAMSYRLPLEHALRWGAVNSASVVSMIGPQPGLLSRDEIEKRLEKRKNFRAERFEI